MYIKSIAYVVAAVSVLISAAAQPLPSDGTDLAGTIAADLRITGHHRPHHRHRHHHKHHHHGHKHRKHHHGDMTYYAPGLGSCGITSGSNDMIVAVAEDLMAPHDGGNPNTNPWCGRHIHIHANGKAAKARIVDTCAGCSGGGLDASPALFQKFADLGVGRITGMHWTIASK